MWFGSLDALVRLVVVGTGAYVVVLVLLRVSGARTLAKLNAFDFVATIALGSVLASAFLTTALPLSTAAAAIALLIGLQWVVAALTRRTGLRRAITATPILLVADGAIRQGVAGRARITAAEIHQAIRSSGRGDLDDIAAAVLETDGTISVITRSGLGASRSLAPVPGWDGHVGQGRPGS